MTRIHEQGPLRTAACKICGDPFTTRHTRKTTCGPECSAENARRNSFRWYHTVKAAPREKAKAEAEARRLVEDPLYAAEVERHQGQLRRIWREHGLPVEELEDLPFYSGGFTTEQAAQVVNG